MDWSSPFDVLGFDAPSAPLMPKLHWQTDAEFANVLHVLERDGAVLLDAVMDADVAQRMRTFYYESFLPTVDDAMVELAALNKTTAFYVAEKGVEGVRVRRNGAPGRFEFKPFDMRDAGTLVQRLGLEEWIDPWVLPAPMRKLVAKATQL